MHKAEFVLKEHITRERAAAIASVASRYKSTLTIERDGMVLNGKSMIGLLSQAVPLGQPLFVVADGEDEQEAVQAVLHAIQG